MRYLTIVRHCEAVLAGPGQSDYERVLSETGQRQAQELRDWASDEAQLGAYGPTTALVSSAWRTKETFRRAFEETSFVSHFETSDLIYNGRRDVSAEDLLIDLAAIDPVTTSLLVVAHNPTVHELVYALSEELPESLRDNAYPLGGAYVLALPDAEQVGLKKYRLVASFIPS